MSYHPKWKQFSSINFYKELLNRRDRKLLYFSFYHRLYVCIGNVRAESYTRPMQHYQNGIVNGAQESRQETFGPECTPDPTLGEALQDTEEPFILNNDEEELLQKLATRHYYRWVWFI